ncbi:hypothetical protein NM688_g6436 [Phlebia brevispora]|uniref:Uncharacterized protein n=1 Tax=Phlebia brevispora TaxID=194682 RepID=A0ACC1SG64_9APHY|nr:hypothetical protein NM688_g6436 [Phlebia brevispora]
MAEAILRSVAHNARSRSPSLPLVAHLSPVASPPLPDLPPEPPLPEPPLVNTWGYWVFDEFTPPPLVSPTPPPDPPRLHFFDDGSGYVFGGPLSTLEGSPVLYDASSPVYGVLPRAPSPVTERHHAALLAEQLALLTLDVPCLPSPPRPLPDWDLDNFDEWNPRDPDFPRMWALVQELFTLTNFCTLDTLFDHQYLGDDQLAPGTASPGNSPTSSYRP